MMTQDLFKTFCHKQCLPELSDEIEIFEDEGEEPTFEEEAVVEEKVDTIDFKAWMKELECMKQRILLLQLRLKEKLDICEEKPCVDLEVELTCSENKEICALQKNQSKLQYQIQELVRCCCFIKEQIKDLRTRMCEKSKDIAQLQRMVHLLESWRKTLDNEFGICLERFEYLKHVKAEWQDVLEKIEKRKECWQTMEQLFVPKSCYKMERKHFNDQADDLREIFKNLCLLQMERYTEMNERMEAFEERLKTTEETAQNAAEKADKCVPPPEKPKKPSQDFDMDAVLLYKEKYESTVPVHKIFFGQKELFPKTCDK